MAFEDSFDELDRMLLAKSADYEKMRALVQSMRQADELARMLGPAQDRLYASIAHGHRKALAYLEAGDVEAAKREMAGAASWLVRRFGGFDPVSLAKAPKVLEELQAIHELAEHSDVLREALKSLSYDIHAT